MNVFDMPYWQGDKADKDEVELHQRVCQLVKEGKPSRIAHQQLHSLRGMISARNRRRAGLPYKLPRR